METAHADHNHPHHPSVETTEALETPLDEAQVATGGLIRRLARVIQYKAIEVVPILGRFAEVQTACACDTGCPACITTAAGSIIAPLIVRDRKGQTAE